MSGDVNKNYVKCVKTLKYLLILVICKFQQFMNIFCTFFYGLKVCRAGFIPHPTVIKDYSKLTIESMSWIFQIRISFVLTEFGSYKNYQTILHILQHWTYFKLCIKNINGQMCSCVISSAEWIVIIQIDKVDRHILINFVCNIFVS